MSRRLKPNAELRKRFGIRNDEDLDYSLYILEILQYPPDRKIVKPITPAQFFTISILSGEDRNYRFRAKYFFNPIKEQITITCPHAINEAPITNLVNAACSYGHELRALYDDRVFTIMARQNSYMRSHKSFDHHAVPDFQLYLSPGGYGPPHADVVLWLGECRFTLYADEMRARLAALTAENPSVELAFVISITEDAEFRCPDEDSEPAQALLGEKPHTLEEFLPDRTPETFFGVTVGGTVWINITEVRYTVYMRGADGTFNFNVSDGANAATGTLYPTIDMDAVGAMFARGAEQLKASVIKAAGEWHAVAAADKAWRADRSRPGASILGQQSESAPGLDLEWGEIQIVVSNAAYMTAYHRYLVWYRGIKQKCADGVSGKENGAREEGDENAEGSDEEEDDEEEESEDEDEDEEDEDGDEDMSGEEDDDDDDP